MKRKFHIMFVMFIIIGAVLVGCEESKVEKVEAGESTSNEEETDGTPKTEIFAVGDTVQYNELQITLIGARIVEDELFEPEYDQYVAVELDIENTSDESVAISTLLNMSLLTADGYAMDHALVSGKGSLDGEISPGRKLKGEVVFDVEQSDYYEFIFEDPITLGQAIWKIESNQIQN